MAAAALHPMPDSFDVAEQYVRLLIDDSPSTMAWVTDLDLRVTSVRGGALRVAGLDTRPILGRTLIEILRCHDGPDDVVFAHMQALTGESASIEVQWNERSYVVSISPFRIGAGTICGAIGTAADVTDQRRSARTSAWHQGHDLLTSLPNRAHLREMLKRSIIEARRTEETLALLLMDLDGFSSVNDAWGENVGDGILRQVAEALRLSTGEEAFVARTDGDEFAIVIANVDDDAVRSGVQRLSDLMQRPFTEDGREVLLTASFGGALYPSDGDNVHHLMRCASLALRRSKDLGGGQYHRCSPSMIVPARERLTLSNELRRAIDRKELSLHYQPQIRLEDGALVAMEALLRWNHGGAVVAAAHFIRVAEESQLIVPIGEWVLDEACRQFTEWVVRGIAPQRVAVNIGARHFHHPDLVATVRETLERHGLAGDILEIEITETAAMHDLETTMAVIHELRLLGVEITIDDFGTGHSSLSYLRQFAITALKVDRSFVADLGQTEAAGALINAIMTTAHALGLRVVAEGVEKPAQMEWLRAAGCDEAQGYLFAKPVNADEATAYLRHAGKPSIA